MIRPHDQPNHRKDSSRKEESGLVWERPLVLNGDAATLRQWMVQRIAERAVQILEQQHNSSGKN